MDAAHRHRTADTDDLAAVSGETGTIGCLVGHHGDMTAQFPDTVVLEGDEYAIAGISGSVFEAQAYGLKPRMISTACWRG